MKFYYAPMSCAFATHVVLEDAEAKYEAIKIDLKNGDQNKPEFLKINPKGRVPALVTEKGILTENPAIMYYICQLFPEKKLAPTDPYELAKAKPLTCIYHQQFTLDMLTNIVDTDGRMIKVR